MSLTIDIEDRPELQWVGLPVTARLTEFGTANALIPRVFGWLGEHGVSPLSGPMYVYHRIGDLADPIDLTVTVPVAQAIAASGGLVAGSLPAGTYVVGRVVGPPDSVGPAQRQVEEWAAEKGLHLSVEVRDGIAHWTGRADVFLTDPQQQPDETQWQTQLLYLTV